MPTEEAPAEGFNLQATADLASDAAWVPKKERAFPYNPEEKDMAHSDPETFSKYLRGLVRALAEVVQGRDFAPGRSPDNMKAMRDMLKKAVQHRRKL